MEEMSEGERLRVFQQFRSGGAGVAETPFPAVRLDLVRQRGKFLRLFLAEILHGARRFEERDHVVDRADVFLQFRQKRVRGGLFAGGPDGVDSRLCNGLEVLASRRCGDHGFCGFDEFLFRHFEGFLSGLVV